ncbi:uncharacterized protein LOC135200921 [Macrobrachium nipponense]|uniref:uncharacterized protein LOC135200921 n=1 Tax=Macrobrachium nipponense TaxID=159736 RepID=UPI0030C7AE62
MWSSQSQPDMALIGVKSVLSPRPFSAPHTMESFSATGHLGPVPHRRENGADDSESDSYELESEHGESYIDETASLSSDQLEEASKGSTDQSKASIDYGSFDCGSGTESNNGDIGCGEDASSFNAALRKGEDSVPPGIHRLRNLNSKDSAFGSSTEQKPPSLDDQATDSLSEGAIDDVQNTCASENESHDSQYKRLNPNNSATESQSNDSQDKHTLNAKDSNQDTIKDVDLPSNEGETMDRGSTLKSESLTKKNYSKNGYHETVLLQSQASYRRPLIPPSIITFDLSTDQEEVLIQPAESLQETVDKKILEAQKTGHLDLANIGLPFIPSAILLSESSMIHRVSLQDNGLVELPGAAMEHLTSVTWLDLRYNELRALPSEISHLTRLQVLLLQGNRLTALPVVLGTLTEITTLQVSDNPLSFPPRDVINGGTRAILSFLKSKCPKGEKPPTTSSSSAPRRKAKEEGGDEDEEEEEEEGRGETPSQGNHMRRRSSYASHLRRRNFGQRSQPSENVDEVKVVPGVEIRREEEEEQVEEDEEEEEEEEDEGREDDGKENKMWESDSEHEEEMAAMSETTDEMAGSEGHYKRQRPYRSSSTSAASSMRYLSASPNSLQIAIKDGRETSDHLNFREALDSGRDTLGRPPSPSSPCLLTPNIEFPRRPQYDLTAEQSLEDECPFKDENCPSWTCDCFKNSSPLSKDKLKVINKLPDEAIKQRLLNSMTGGQGQFYLHQCMMLNDPQGRQSAAAHRRSLHLRLQKDNIEIEDDLESLEGDIGEGYRRPHSEPVGDKEKECHRQMSAETVLPLPIVSLQLPSPHDLRGGGCSGKRYRRPLARRTGLDGLRKSKQGMATRMNGRDVQKPKLVTVSEVHRRAREERRRQREKLAATREMVARQRLKSDEELEAWRDEAREMQMRQQQHYSLHPDLFLPAVCEAPFAIDGTTLTPRARAKIKPRDHKRSSSPSVSDVSGVCAGVRKCLDELSDSSKGTNSKHHVGGGEGRALSHTASLVHQLSHLRRQLNRLRVNYVI